MQKLGTRTELDTVARVRPWTIAASAAIGWSLFTLVILHAVSSFDPVLDALSRYAFTDQGSGMLEASLLSFAVGVVAVRGALLGAGVPFGRTTSVLFACAALGLVMAALFPASFTSDIDPVTGRVHQYASLIAFLSLPAIGLTLLDGLREIPAPAASRAMLIRVLFLCWSSLALFGVSYVAAALPGYPMAATIAEALPVGFTQRLTFVADFALLMVLVVLAARTARLRQATQE
ncbi:DUF998 domain-containing protein [Qaidamihabitans albus]|uniref:DUF998 domain-containing protein n=1 Tax=Qaidamihabitans albus TaxID=2795733 RepID=UPI0018F27812|nr:DUF998 domain-containing protein [Qaidamihabitans albus]